jgi:ATP-dependent DNA helicase RecQ
MRVIAVGDDDQSIYEFRGASSQYLERFIQENNAVKHELLENYRSKSNLVDFTNQFVKQIHHRLKSNPVLANQSDLGMIKLVHYESGNLIAPVVHDILTTGLVGTTCVLTKTNEEALQITGLLLNNDMPAKLIQTNEGFSLYNLLEVRHFFSQFAADVYSISDEIWEEAKRDLVDKFGKSTKLEICKNLIKDFEATNTKRKYRSDLEVFIRESKLEDFFGENVETIMVSTIHKAKGKEFDNVFLLLEDWHPTSDEAKRLLYVAMTRAKSRLSIHFNTNFLDRFSATNLERVDDNSKYELPNGLTMHLSLKDVYLDYFIKRQYLISQLVSGDRLEYNGIECLNANGKSVLRFSQKFVKKVEEMKERNFELRSVKVNFVVYWLQEGAEKEVRIVLPEVYFERVMV